MEVLLRGIGRGALGAAVLVGLVVGVSLARAATPPSDTITPDSGPVPWQGQFYAAGGNVSNFAGDQLCFPSYPGGPPDPGAAPVHQCDVFELEVDVPDGYWLSRSGGVRIDIRWESEDNDFDMYVYKKPPAGEPVGAPVASSAQGATTEEHVIISRAEGTYLVRVNPFSVAGSDYEGEASFELRDPIPAVPGGLAQSRASSSGFLSYSEPHIAVDPLNPNHLVAGSKMYQNLPEYLFKIGTFASFDGGQTWQDNGQLPGYPEQTGTEGDEYHITSDVWVAFDDEGNAYAMVLDSPPDSQVTGAGWGMNVHKSTDGGRTWSEPIPIEQKEDPVTKELFLSDKNTMTVDNFGPDRDGETGNIYACWSEDAPVANLAVLVSRSTDAGETWSQGVPVSGGDQSVIGCFVLVGPPPSPDEPGVLYVFWLDFGGDGLIRMATSTDGGESFSSPSTVAEIDQIPRVFPNSAFRNLSLPWAAVDPNDGTVYVTWADYHDTVEGGDCPGEVPDDEVPAGQVCDADILITRSVDEGDTWSVPVRVNGDPIGNGKDQFQQAVEVTQSGQLNMMWFDRRNDPQNFYIDTFFARSGDDGETWQETRVTRSMWDPSINPPISPSGEFIGDYQGLAVNDCFAYPFWQDTTLANLAPSDPLYSPYQEVFSTQIPNKSEFGGAPVAGVDCVVPRKARCQGKQATVIGTDAVDILFGGRGRDVFALLGGKDRVRARGGNDVVCGGGGKDHISGGAKNDKVKGGGGRDTLKGNAGKDKLRGQGGRDKLKGGAKADRLHGGRKADKLRGGGGKDILRGKGGRDRLRGEGGSDKLNGGTGVDSCDGGPGTDRTRACED